MKTVLEAVIIIYLLGLFPLLSGFTFFGGKRKDICKAYLYGYVLQICAFMGICLLEMHLGADLFVMTKTWKFFVLLGTILCTVLLVFRFLKDGRLKDGQGKKQKIRISFLWHCVVLLVLVGILTFFMRDPSEDGLLKQILYAYYHASLPKTGSPYPVYFSMLSVFSGMHPTVIAKWFMPFVTCFCTFFSYQCLGERIFPEQKKRQSVFLWLVLWLFLILCYDPSWDFSSLWMVPWGNEAFIFHICIPLLISLLLKYKQYTQTSVRQTLLLRICMVMAAFVLAFPRRILRDCPKLFLWMVLAACAAVIFILFMIQNKKVLKPENVKSENSKLKNTKPEVGAGYTAGNKTKHRIIICVSIMLLLSVGSVATRGCILTKSAYAVPDNRFKTDADVMQLRISLEPFAQVKMLAPVEVMDQITDIDEKAAVLYDSDILKKTAWKENGLQSDDKPEIPDGIADVAEDIERNGYEDIKLIQHALKYGCNVVAAYAGADRAAQDAFYETYDFRLLSENGRYVLYQYAEGLGDYVVTQYASLSGKQAMIYTITDWENHLILVDGGWDADAELLHTIISGHGGHVDTWILTHPHPDHIGAFNSLYAGGDISVGQIYATPMDYDYYKSMANWWDEFEVYERFLELAAGMDNITYVTENDSFDICGLRMDVFYSFNREEQDKVGSMDPCNDGGIVFKLSGKENSMLFLADVGALLSDYIIEGHRDGLSADYVQMGHHGNGGSKEELLELVHPLTAFFDCTEEIMRDQSLNAAQKRKFMENMGADIRFYANAPSSVVIR